MRPNRHDIHPTSESIQNSLPWRCTHFGAQSEIEFYDEKRGGWFTIAEVYQVGKIDAEELAEYVVNLVNKICLSDAASK